MKIWIQPRLARMLAGILCAGLAATWAVGKVLDKQELLRQDKHEVARMTQKMKTECVGRFLIDMPEEAVVEIGQARIDGFKITAFDESADEFHERLAQREAQIKARPDRLGGNRNLETARDIRTDAGFTGKMFVHSRTVDEGTQGNGLAVERYRYEGVTTEALMHGDGVSVDLSSEGRDPAWIDDLPAMVGKLVPNPGNAIPKEAGFCIDRAYIRDPLPADQREGIMMFARLPSHPDIEFMFILSAGLKPDAQGLLERSNDALDRRPLDERMRITKLRASPRDIGGIAGEELVELLVEENDANVHSFWWEVNGTEDNVLVPHLLFKMSTGNGVNGPVPSSLSDGVALGLWDRIASSIRLRPIAAQPDKRPEPAPVPIGTHAAAGEHCPHSGWWLCGDGGQGIGVLGGQTQYIREGELMPQALLLPAQTWWERLRGLQPSVESTHRTPWKLVDKRSQKRIAPALPLARALGPASGELVQALPATGNPGRAQLGSFAVTGAPCPASGWWRCEDSHALDGTRWFAHGSLLPAATFAIPASVFGRASTAPRAIQRRGTWRLVRLADAIDGGAAGPGEAASGARPDPPLGEA